MSTYTYTAKVLGRRSLNAAQAGMVMRGELAGDHVSADHSADLALAVVHLLQQSGQMPEIADEIAIALVRHVPPALQAGAEVTP